jgi:hypothetical protein
MILGLMECLSIWLVVFSWSRVCNPNHGHVQIIVIVRNRMLVSLRGGGVN